MDFIKEIEQLNIQHAIKGKVATKLKDILPLLSKERLKFLAAGYEVSGRSKMKKQELIEMLYQSMTDVKEVATALLIAGPAEWDLANMLLKAPYTQDDNLYPGKYLFLMDKGLMYSFYDEGKLFYLIPEEIREVYLAINSKAFRDERNRHQLVIQYINAATNLYGVCPKDKLIEIFNAQNQRPLTEAEFYGIYIHISARDRTWYLESNNLICDYFGYESRDELEMLLKGVENKPYYIPQKQEFLLYSDSGYFEKTPQLAHLQKFILQHLCKDETIVESLMDDLQLACSMEEPLDVIMAEFERRNIHFQKREQLQTILPLIVDVYNHTRVWSNRGHTPAELGSNSSQANNKNNIVYLDRQVISTKIGRNESCPCGSGKKYKKCCGQ